MFVTVSELEAGARSVTGVPVAAGPSSRTPRPRRRWGRLIAPYLYILPAVAFLIAFAYSPLVQAFGLSVYQWNLLPTSPKRFVGLGNFAQALAMPEVHQALGNTVVYILALAVFSLVLPLVIALVSQQVRGRWKTFYQALIFVPFLLTPVATSAVWRWLFNAEGGAIPTVMGAMGVDMGNIFRDPSTAIIAVIVAVGWQMLGFGVLVISAGLAGISPDYRSAASLDGAGTLRILWRITLPLLSPTLVFLGLMTILLAAPWTFSFIDIITQGGPAGATTNIYYILYTFGFQNFNVGMSAALGVLFFLAFGIIAFVFVEISERLSFYDN